MKTRWLTYVALGGMTALLVGPAIAQTSGSGSSTTPAPGAGSGSSGSGSGTSGPTNPQPAPSTAQPGSPSVGTAPGKAMPSTQPSAGQAGSGTTGSSASKPMATNGQADADQVKSLQKALQEKGMDPGPIDGIIGPRTQAALRAYQKDQKLPETGRLDSQTREKLGVSN